jgi:glycolate oxidase FAD binding subunit
MIGLGYPPARPGVIVDLRQLDRVIDYPARDMTITVQAGITLAQLSQVLAAENQRLPVDVPRATEATLGGAMAANASGPRRYGFGTLRDYVIGMSVINDEGHEVKAGGRVVKNVAGYDLCKLHIGALGTLGIITQVTLKLRPLPEAHALAALGCPAHRLELLLNAIHHSRTRPVCVELLNAAAARQISLAARLTLPADAWVILIGYEHNRQAVDWQVRQLMQELASLAASTPEVYAAAEAIPLWEALVEFSARPEACLLFKANVLPSQTADYCAELSASDKDLLLQAHAGNGIVLGQMAAGLTLEQATILVDQALQAAVRRGGNLILWRCPSAWKKTLPIWGAPRLDAWLMKAIKNKLDPRGRFNPGRFVDGI